MPYTFVLFFCGLLTLWSDKNVLLGKTKPPSAISDEKIYKFRNAIWNKIIKTTEFDGFSDREYFKWLEIYKHSNEDILNVKPTSIEQKMALIETANSKLVNSGFFAEKIQTSEFQELSALKLRILQKHLKIFKSRGQVTAEELKNFSSDLSMVLKTPPISLLDYFTKNKTNKMAKGLVESIQEDVLLMGLRGMIERVSHQNIANDLKRSEFLTKKFFQSKSMEQVITPENLSLLHRAKIPEELLQKIVIDGLLTHNQELITHLKKQDMSDYYEHFRKVYKVVTFSISFSFYYDKFNSIAVENKRAISQEEKRPSNNATQESGQIMRSLQTLLLTAPPVTKGL